MFKSVTFNDAFTMFNTKEKRYPNGDVVIKRINNLCYKKNDGYEPSDGEKQTRSEKTFETEEERTEYLEKKAVENMIRTRTCIYDLARANEWTHFVTLTFSNETCDRYDYSDCIKQISKYMDNFKQRNKETCPNFRYLLVHEKHKDGAFHFHGVINLEDTSKLVKAVYPPGAKKENQNIIVNGKQIYNWETYKKGFSTLTEMNDFEKTCMYITKYISKDVNEDYQKGRRRYIYSSNCIKPTVSRYMSDMEEFEIFDPLYQSIYSTGFQYNIFDYID